MCTAVIDRTYRSGLTVVTLCPTCGAVVPATGKAGAAAVVAPHPPRG